MLQFVEVDLLDGARPRGPDRTAAVGRSVGGLRGGQIDRCIDMINIDRDTD